LINENAWARRPCHVKRKKRLGSVAVRGAFFGIMLQMESPGAFHDFQQAAQAVMMYLHVRIGFDLWMVTRVEGEEWIILQVEDHGYGVKPGTVYKWADSFCHEMVKGNGPNVCPRVDCVPAYSQAGLSRAAKIGAYIGFPLKREDGTIFGTLCAVHPAAQPNQIMDEQPMIELLSQLLSTVLNTELKTQDGARHEERLAAQKFVDPQTDLFGRRGWEQLLAAEEGRCVRYGHPACVVVIDVHEGPTAPVVQDEDAADALVHSAAQAISAVTRTKDVVARLGPRQFGVLAVECDRAGSKALLRRVNEALATERIWARVGVAHRMPPMTLDHAWSNAEREAAESGSSR
jgi:diguanylate cyclase